MGNVSWIRRVVGHKQDKRASLFSLGVPVPDYCESSGDSGKLRVISSLIVYSILSECCKNFMNISFSGYLIPSKSMWSRGGSISFFSVESLLTASGDFF